MAKGDYERYQTMTFFLPYPFLLLCKILELKPASLLSDCMDNLACGSWKRQGRDKAKALLIEYFIEMGYGQQRYTPEDIRTMFAEMDALGRLFPSEADNRLIDAYSKWRDQHEQWWFYQWYQKPRRKI